MELNSHISNVQDTTAASESSPSFQHLPKRSKGMSRAGLQCQEAPHTRPHPPAPWTQWRESQAGSRPSVQEDRLILSWAAEPQAAV